jgi:rRNA-processing protein FCF1
MSLVLFMYIILDTNFLIYCAKSKLDYVEEIGNLIRGDYELVVPLQVVEELKRVRDKLKEKIPLKKRTLRYRRTTGRDKDAAALALDILTFNKINRMRVDGESVDEGIINLAGKDKKNIVCTLDREMRRVLGRVILINSKGRLILTK